MSFTFKDITRIRENRGQRYIKTLFSRLIKSFFFNLTLEFWQKMTNFADYLLG